MSFIRFNSQSYNSVMNNNNPPSYYSVINNNNPQYYNSVTNDNNNNNNNNPQSYNYLTHNNNNPQSYNYLTHNTNLFYPQSYNYVTPIKSVNITPLIQVSSKYFFKGNYNCIKLEEEKEIILETNDNYCKKKKKLIQNKNKYDDIGQFKRIQSALYSFIKTKVEILESFCNDVYIFNNIQDQNILMFDIKQIPKIKVNQIVMIHGTNITSLSGTVLNIMNHFVFVDIANNKDDDIIKFNINYSTNINQIYEFDAKSSASVYKKIKKIINASSQLLNRSQLFQSFLNGTALICDSKIEKKKILNFFIYNQINNNNNNPINNDNNNSINNPINNDNVNPINNDNNNPINNDNNNNNNQNFNSLINNNNPMTSNQLEAIEYILNNTISIIQGAPGMVFFFFFFFFLFFFFFFFF